MRKISTEGLAGVLEQHQKWLQSDGKQGEQANLEEANLFEATLAEAKLNRAQLGGAYLRGAKLRGADLSSAILFRAFLGRADLSGGMLNGADLSGADLTQANLSGADLRKAKLTLAILSSALLGGADLGDAQCNMTMFANVDLSEVAGLETVNHTGPSTIGVDTLIRSQGNIPGAFLRGCGLSDWEIESAKLYRSNLSEAEQPTSCMRFSVSDKASPFSTIPFS